MGSREDWLKMPARGCTRGRIHPTLSGLRQAFDERKALSNKEMKPVRHILIVEDERDLADLLSYNLDRAGYRTTTAHDGRSALVLAGKLRPDLVLLDLMIPELPGTEVASRIRSDPQLASTPIIMLTARTDEVDQLVGLTVGADDYITKPFSIRVLLARIEAVLRRSGEVAAVSPSLKLGPLVLNADTHEASVEGRPVKLTLTEFRLLAALLQAEGRVLSRARLMSKAMGPGVTVTERTIDVHMTAIRRKLGGVGAFIRTVRGVGYRATADAGAAAE